MQALEWILTEWHSYSSSEAPIEMDGVLFQDLFSILKTIMEDPSVLEWANSLKDLYSHITNYDNPHHVTIDQLPTTMIDILYSKWRELGYEGDKEHFTDTLYLFLEIMNYEEVITHYHLSNDRLIPTVQAVYQYLQDHNSRKTAHQSILTKVFPGTTPPRSPVIHYDSSLGVRVNNKYLFKKTSTTNNTVYEHTNVLSSYTRYFTLVSTFNLSKVSGLVAAIGSSTCLTLHCVSKKIEVRSTNTILNTTSGLVLTKLTPPRNQYVTCALIYQDNTTTLAYVDQDPNSVTYTLVNELSDRSQGSVPLKRINRLYQTEANELVKTSQATTLLSGNLNLYFSPIGNDICTVSLYDTALKPGHLLYLGTHSYMYNQ